MKKQRELPTDEAELLKSAKLRAMNLLKVRDRTERQLRERLAMDGYPEQMVEEAVNYVKSYHYVDDRTYAENYIAYRLGSKSRSALRGELIQKGVDSHLVDEVLEETEQDDTEALRKAVEKKCRSLPQPYDIKQKEKIYAALMRKGFQLSDIKKEVADYLASAAEN